MEEGGSLCISTFQTDPKDSAQDGRGPSRRPSHLTTLANSSVVPSDADTSDSRTGSTANKKTRSSAKSFRPCTSSSPKTSTVGSRVIREAMEAQGFSGTTCTIVCASWRDSTKEQYPTYIRKWKRACTERDCDPFHPSVHHVLGFLTVLFEKGLGYSTINTGRSAISAIIMTQMGKKSIASHPKVVRFMEGVYELRPPLPRCTVSHTCDVAVILDHITKQSKTLIYN